MKEISTILVGNKNEIAVEVKLNDLETSLGFVYLYLRSKKFGFSDFTYNTLASLGNINENIHHNLDPDFGRLIDCPVEKTYNSFDFYFEEFDGFEPEDIEGIEETLLSCEADDYYPDFVKKYILDGELDNCVFRLGHYAFQNQYILLIPSQESLLVCVKNEGGLESYSYRTTKSNFRSIWLDLHSKLKTLTSRND